LLQLRAHHRVVFEDLQRLGRAVERDLAAVVAEHGLTDLHVGMCVGEISRRKAHADFLETGGVAIAKSARPMKVTMVQAGSEMPSHAALILAQSVSPRRTFC